MSDNPTASIGSSPHGRWALIVVGVALCVVALVRYAPHVTDALSQGADAIEANAMAWGLWRFGLLATGVLCWPRLVRTLSTTRGLSIDQSARLRALRWHALASGIVFDVVVVQGWPARWLAGTVS